MFHVVEGWQNVMDGITAAVEEGFEKVKVNCVVMRGLNDDEICDFVRLSENMVSDV